MINFQEIFRYLDISINKELIDVLGEHAVVKHYKKGDLLIKEGQIAYRLYYLKKGTARTFYYHNAKDITSWIYQEDRPFTAWASYLNRQPSFENIEILEDSIIVSYTKEVMEDLYLKYPAFGAYGRKMVEQQLAFLDAYYKGYMFMTAKERYDLLLSNFPDITQRVNLGHIASLLGISQETLSRIRGKR